MVNANKLWLLYNKQLNINKMTKRKKLETTGFLLTETKQFSHELSKELPHLSCRGHTWLCNTGCSACCCTMSSHSDPQCGTHNALTQLPSGVEQGTDKTLHPAGKTDSSKEKK